MHHILNHKLLKSTHIDLSNSLYLKWFSKWAFTAVNTTNYLIVSHTINNYNLKLNRKWISRQWLNGSKLRMAQWWVHMFRVSEMYIFCLDSISFCWKLQLLFYDFSNMRFLKSRYLSNHKAGTFRRWLLLSKYGSFTLEYFYFDFNIFTFEYSLGIFFNLSTQIYYLKSRYLCNHYVGIRLSESGG